MQKAPAPGLRPRSKVLCACVCCGGGGERARGRLALHGTALQRRRAAGLPAGLDWGSSAGLGRAAAPAASSSPSPASLLRRPLGRGGGRRRNGSFDCHLSGSRGNDPLNSPPAGPPPSAPKPRLGLRGNARRNRPGHALQSAALAGRALRSGSRCQAPPSPASPGSRRPLQRPPRSPLAALSRPNRRQLPRRSKCNSCKLRRGAPNARPVANRGA